MDFPTAWAIARGTPAAEHDPRCSYARYEGGFLCDCHVLTGHPQYVADYGPQPEGEVGDGGSAPQEAGAAGRAGGQPG